MHIGGNTRVYTEMVSTLKREISGGHLLVGDRLPSESELAATFSISVNSVRAGIMELVDAGIVEKRQGSGTYVIDLPSEQWHPVQRRDTIAILYDNPVHGYHPFFSELRKGVELTLCQLGWRLLTPQKQLGFDTVNQTQSHDYIEQLLEDHPELAGGIFASGHARTAYAVSGGDFPLVVPSVADADFACAYYDWGEEMFQAIRHTLSCGARRLLVITHSLQHDPKQCIRMAECLEKLPANSASLHWEPTRISKRNVFSSWINGAIKASAKALQAGNYDGIVAGSDFELQGLLDCIVELGLTHKNYVITGLVSAKSQIMTEIPYHAVVSDGFQQGTAAARLLHEKIASPDSPPGRVVLRGMIRQCSAPPEYSKMLETEPCIR